MQALAAAGGDVDEALRRYQVKPLAAHAAGIVSDADHFRLQAERHPETTALYRIDCEGRARQGRGLLGRWNPSYLAQCCHDWYSRRCRVSVVQARRFQDFAVLERCTGSRAELAGCSWGAAVSSHVHMKLCTPLSCLQAALRISSHTAAAHAQGAEQAGRQQVAGSRAAGPVRWQPWLRSVPPHLEARPQHLLAPGWHTLCCGCCSAESRRGVGRDQL